MEDERLTANLHAFFPTDPEVPPCQEAGNCVASKMMNPAFLMELSHNGINPGKSSLGLRSANGLCHYARLPWLFCIYHIFFYVQHSLYYPWMLESLHPLCELSRGSSEPCRVVHICPWTLLGSEYLKKATNKQTKPLNFQFWGKNWKCTFYAIEGIMRTREGLEFGLGLGSSKLLV